MSEAHSLLICEDNSPMAELLRYTLKTEGYTVTIARTGTDAVKRVSTEKYDLVLTDYQMPGANGEDVCRTVRETPHNANIPLVMYTAKGFELCAEDLRARYGVARLINKPFSPRAMVRLVRSLLDPNAEQPQRASILAGSLAEREL